MSDDVNVTQRRSDGHLSLPPQSLPPDRMPGQAMWAAAPSEPPLARRAPRHMSFDSVATNAQDSPVSYQARAV